MRPLLLDLFCGAGGAAMGYQRAGFQVIGVDINPQPNYPFTFIQSDALSFVDFGAWNDQTYEEWFEGCGASGFTAIHASPPCQVFTAYRRKGHGVGEGYSNLIPETRQALARTGLPYVIENVEEARAELHDPVTVCGSSFALDVRRHRLFETNWPLVAPPCEHGEQELPGKRYPGATNRDGRYTCEVGAWRIPLYRQKVAMGGIYWMGLKELSEAIPPAYTEHIGKQLLAHLSAEKVAA